jgi:hypothetical protein
MNKKIKIKGTFKGSIQVNKNKIDVDGEGDYTIDFDNENVTKERKFTGFQQKRAPLNPLPNGLYNATYSKDLVFYGYDMSGRKRWKLFEAN